MNVSPRMVWGGLLAAGGLYEFYALVNDQEGDTLSEVTRDVFGVETKRGRALFLTVYVGFSVWFVPHIAARAMEAADDETVTRPGRFLRRVLWPTGRRR